MVNANGTKVGYHYDNLNRLVNVTNWGTSNNVISSYSYALNNAGIRTAVTELDGSRVDYGYDASYKLTSEIRTGTHPYSISYTYDNVGNRLTQTKDGVLTTYSYNNRDQLVTENLQLETISYTYDHAGRMTNKTDNAGATSYTWIDNDRMAQVSGPGVLATYEYDAAGQRVSETSGAATKKYLIDYQLPYGQVIAETDNSGNLVAGYVYGLGRISQSRGGNVHYYAADGQGSTRQLTDAGGNVTDSWTFDAFGNTINRTGTTENSFLYVGESFDPNCGFYNLRARWYSPTTGTFTSVDPYSGDRQAPASLHRYLYANASPITYFDPLGKFTQSFGYAVEDEVDNQYAASHSGDDVSYGGWARMGERPRLKPDILNRTQKIFNEIKPLSFYGIGSGFTQIELYQAMFSDENYIPDKVWTPEAKTITDPVSGRPVPVWFKNFEGIIFYTDIEQVAKEVAVATTAAIIYQAVSNSKSLFTLTSDVGRIRALFSIALESRVAQIRSVQCQTLSGISLLMLF